jgi:hypothetical protein
MEASEPNKESKSERIKRLLHKYEQALNESLSENPQTLEEIEREVSEIGKKVQKDLQEEKLQHSSCGAPQPWIPCSCGHRARHCSDHRRHVLTLHGPVTLVRAYYYCRSCNQGGCPLDAQLGLDKGETSLGVRGLIARLCAYMPDRKATCEAELLTGVKLAPSTVQHLSRAMGQQLVREWKSEEELLRSNRLSGPSVCVPCLHTSMDGVFIYVDKKWCEVKIGVVYQRGEAGIERAAYYTSLAKSSDFGRRWRTLTYKMGSGQCRRLVVVADGADWIWQETGKYAPMSVQILDFYHAVEHLWVVARTRFGEGSQAASEWMSLQKDRLLDDKVNAVIADIQAWRPATVAGEEVREGKLNYLLHHAHRMRYKTFREAGYHIGSGVVEAGCKATVQGRMKGAGMRWSEAGAEAMLHLRAAWCTSQQTDFVAIARRESMAA